MNRGGVGARSLNGNWLWSLVERDLGYTDNEPHEHISDVLFRRSRRCLSAKPVRERDPPRGVFF
jgi:hypothetical protein